MTEEPVLTQEQQDSIFKSYANIPTVVLKTKNVPKFCEKVNGKIEWNLHLGQRYILASKKRIIAAIAGRQSGKSAIGPIWLYREMRRKGPGIYLVVAPSYPLLLLSAIPKIKELFSYFLKLGNFTQNPPAFNFTAEGTKALFKGTKWESVETSEETIIRFGHAANPESLEAVTALAAWLDEAGQNAFKTASWEAVQGRLTVNLGRVLITTTPYNLGWLKTRVVNEWERYRKDGKDHPDIDVITWKSTTNPRFSEAEYLRLKETMPFWKWDMFYNGNFSVPAGLIYGVAKELEDQIKFSVEELPQYGTVMAGIDFGGPNFACVMAKRDPVTGVLFVYRAYRPGQTMPDALHVKNIYEDCRYYDRVAGGAKSEVTQRLSMLQNGLRVEEPPITDVQAGIDRVYGLMRQGRLRISSELTELWSEIFTYQYETNPETGEVKDELKIEKKSSYHLLDALRYLCSMVSPEGSVGVARAGGDRVAIGLIRDETNRALGLQDDNAPNAYVSPDLSANRVSALNARVARGGGTPSGGRPGRRFVRSRRSQ